MYNVGEGLRASKNKSFPNICFTMLSCQLRSKVTGMLWSKKYEHEKKAR